MFRIKFLKKLDQLVGSAVVGLVPPPRRATVPETIGSILIIRPGGIGDAVLLLPSITVFRQKFPDVRITVLAERRNGAVFTLCPAVDDLLLYDRRCDLLKAVHGVYDAVVDTEQWHRLSAVIARLSGAPVSVGYATNNRQKLFSVRVAYSDEQYEVDSFFNLFATFGIRKPETLGPYAIIPPAASVSARRKLEQFISQPYLVIFPGASIAERRWGWKQFRAVAESLRQERGVTSVVVGGAVDWDEGEKIVAGMEGLNLAGKTSLAETAAVIAGGSLLLSGDSGVLHLGVALDKPTVSLFGPGIAAKWAPQGSNHVVLNGKLPCSPCTRYGYTPTCRNGAACMSAISTAEVSGAVCRVLDRANEAPAENIIKRQLFS